MRVTQLAAIVLAALLMVGCSPAAQILSALPTTTTTPPTGGIETAEPTEAEETPAAVDTVTPAAGATTTPAPASELDIDRLATGERPMGWVEVQSNSPDCTMALPGDWTLLPLSEAWFSGMSADGHMAARAVQDAVTTWPEYVARLKATYFNELSDNGQVVLAETDRVFVMRETANGGKAHILALNGGPTACGIVESIDEVAAAEHAQTAIQILYTLSGPEVGGSASP